MEDRIRILGVDDSLTIRKALEIVLKPAGYDLELAVDGAEALTKAKDLQPALILLDFILPDLHGTDVCRQLAADPATAHIPVVLISAKGAEIEQAYRDVRNVVSYIAKPFTPPVLTGVVSEVLARAAGGDLVKLRGGEDEATVPIPPPSREMPTPNAPEPPLLVAAANVDAPIHDIDILTASDSTRAALNDVDDVEDEAAPEPQIDDALVISRRERIEWMFETLRSGLEGVYVEEVDTRAGAASDQAKTYTDLIDQLSRQLDEGLQHAQSGARYRLYGDGSIRSFDDTLLDVFRRSCRLLFRAAAAGTRIHETAAAPQRVLIACQRHSSISVDLHALLAEHSEWSAVIVTENFRQLPLLVRLYGPSVIVAEVTWTGALWDQLRVIQRLPEASGIRLIGVSDPADATRLSTNATQLVEVGFTEFRHSAFEVERALSDNAGVEDDPIAGPLELRMTA